MLNDEMIREKGIDGNAVQMLVEHGRRKGYLTLTDIVDCLPDSEFDEELLHHLKEVIGDAGIHYFDDVGVLPFVGEEISAEEQAELDELASLEEEPVAADLEEVDTDDMIRLYIKEAAHVPLLTAQQEVELAKRIERCRSAQQELSKGNGEINPERRQELQEQIRLGQTARDRLIRANSRLVISVARKYMNRGLPFLDLIQEGNIGLMRAVRNFDYQRGFKFSTYATWWIRQGVTRALAEQSRTIRLPVHMSDQVGRMLREQNRLLQELGRNPNREELAEALGVSVDKVDQMREVVRQPLSLQTPVGEEEDEILGDFVEDPASGNPEETVTDLLMGEELDKMLQTLPPREMDVLRLRYGLTEEEPLTLQEVGRRLGITRERVRQLEVQAIERLRNPEAPRRKETGGDGRRKRKPKNN